MVAFSEVARMRRNHLIRYKRALALAASQDAPQAPAKPQAQAKPKAQAKPRARRRATSKGR